MRKGKNADIKFRQKRKRDGNGKGRKGERKEDKGEEESGKITHIRGRECGREKRNSLKKF